MVTNTDRELDIMTEARIHDFLDRKTQQFPELERISSKHQPHSLLSRVHDLAASLTHSSQPRHIHH